MTFVYIIGGLIALFIGMQFFTVLSAKRSRGKRILGLQGNLKTLEKHGSAGLVYFYSPGCHACKSVTPVIKQLQAKHKNIFDIDVSKNMAAATAFGIKATPTTILVKDGVVQDLFLGARPGKFIESLISW